MSQATNSTSSTNFCFQPPANGNYLIQARAVIFADFPTDFGTAKTVTAVAAPPVISLSPPIVSTSQVKINFQLAAGGAASFHLLQAGQINGAWTTNASAALTTNVPGSSYQFTIPGGPALQFYRVKIP